MSDVASSILLSRSAPLDDQTSGAFLRVAAQGESPIETSSGREGAYEHSPDPVGVGRGETFRTEEAATMPQFRVTFTRTNTGPEDAPESQLICSVRAKDEDQALSRARAYWVEENQPVDEFTHEPIVENLDDD